MNIRGLGQASLILIILSILSACSMGDESKAWQQINQGALLIDVRTPGEFKSGHLEDAKLIPVDQLPSRLNEFGDDKDRAIVVYCKSGIRSDRAKSLLEEHGFTNVTNGGGYQRLLSSKP